MLKIFAVMKRLLLFLFLILGTISLMAQKTIKGKVVGEDGQSIPGAIVKVKEYPKVATMTDLDGNYVLTNVPNDAKTLVFSFTGMETKEVPITGNVINVTLKQSEIMVKEVTVTALNIKRDEKKIGYAVTSVSSDEIQKTRNRSVLNALEGKIAGVNISTASGAPGASTRVIFRGFSSFTGGNQPLYIVDGIPINNAFSGSTSLNGGTDFGNQANDINPDDIESITFLKGSAATALYGNRAANGVIIITTKKGADKKKGTEVTINSTAKFSTPLRLPQFQNVYGQGIFGNWDQRENTSYGPKFDGKLHYWGHVVDNKRLIKPYKALPTNVADFFEVGHTFQNSVSVAGGDSKTSYFLSYSNVRDDGIMPYDRDTYNRNTVALRGKTKLANHFRSTASFNYVKKTNRFVPTGQGGQSVWNNVLQQPRDIPILELANYKDPFFDINHYYSPYTTNPYWPLLENGNFNNEDRVYGMAELDYDFNDFLSLVFRAGSDVSNRQLKEWRARKINDPNGFNAGVDPEEGRVENYTNWIYQLNTDLILMYNNNFGDFSINALVGHNFNQRAYRSQYQGATGISIPNFYHISNTYGTPVVNQYSSLRRLIGVYGNLEVSYKSWLTLTTSARNDWSSTLPLDHNSFFYPSVSLGWVFTDALPFFENIKKYYTFGKLRFSYGKTGNDAPAYVIYPYFRQPGRFPLPSNTNGFTLSNLAGNPKLTPELTEEVEVGTDSRFFQGRLKIDFTWYNRNIHNLIFPVEQSPSSGYTYQYMNLGKINNRGIELMVTVIPVKTRNVYWEISWNFSHNKSTLVTLDSALEKVDIMGLLGGTEHWFRAYPGGRIGIFEGSARAIWKDPNGVEHIIVDAQGIPKLADQGYVKYGKSEYDFITGFNTNLTLFRFISLSATVDWRQGGIMHSRTAGMVYFTGTTPTTLYNDRQPFIVPNSVVFAGVDKNGNPIYRENTTPVFYEVLGGSAFSYWDMGGPLLGEHEMVSKTFVKLRDLSLQIIIPKKWLAKTPFGYMSLGFVGNNLFIWTPKSNNIIDPELTTYGNDLTADFGEFGATPSVRTLGFSLTFKF